MFVLALAHGGFSIVQFHVLGVVNPLVSVLTSNGSWGELAQFPFQPLGLAALVILFLMAATSHDFWLANLTPPVWKSLHMLVYVAYGLLLLHVGLGVLQAERHPLLAGLLGLGFAWIVAIHLIAGRRERTADREVGGAAGGGRRLRRGLPRRRHRREARPHRLPERRAHRRLPLRRQDLRGLQRLPAPERPAGRGPHHRRLHHLPLARLPVRPGRRRLAAAVHREGAHLPGAAGGRPGAGPSAARAPGTRVEPARLAAAEA